MAGKELRAQVVLAGREDSSFSALGAKLQQMGQMVSGISNKLIELGKESVETYKDYEDGILETRSVLQSQYDDVNQLNKAMSSIEQHAQQWASTTIFHTDDIANAIANAAHAGWDYEKIMQGIPSAMLIAQAGAMELGEGVEYLSKMLASTGTDFADAEGFVNMWAKAADMAATDIGEMGEAFLKLGAAGRLAGSNEELFTMMSVLANVGTVGSDAGTAVRNIMARIAAPTNKAAEAMEALGLSEEEATEALGDLDENSLAAYQRLQEMGFSAYDEQGNLKGFLEIFQDMNMMLSGMDEKSKNDFLKTLFGTKSFSYAMALLDAANDGSLMSIYDAILGVKDSDYAQEKADTLMSGLTGSTEILMSKWEEFQRKVGEVISGPLESVQGFLGGILDTMNQIDPTALEPIVAGLSVIAAAGPGLIAAGSFVKIISALGIGSALPWVGLAAAFVAATTALSNFMEMRFEDQFGTMDMESDKILQYVNGLNSAFQSGYTDIDNYNTALQTAIDNYTNYSQDFSNDLLTKMITGAKLTEDDKTNLQKLGGQMHTELMNGITASFDSTAEYLNMLFGGADAANGEEYADAIMLAGNVYDALISQAQTLGAEFGATLGAAMDDGIITGDEYGAIMEKLQAYNDALAFAAQAENAGEMAVMMDRAQGVSWDSFSAFEAEMSTTLADAKARERESYLRNRAAMEQYYKYAAENGLTKEDGTAYTYNADTSVDSDWSRFVNEYDRNYNDRMTALETQNAQVMATAFEGVMRGSGLWDAWQFMSGFDGNLTSDQLAQIQGQDGLLDSLVGLTQSFGQLQSTMGPWLAMTGFDISQWGEWLPMLVEAAQNTGAEDTETIDQYEAERRFMTGEGMYQPEDTDITGLAKGLRDWLTNPLGSDREDKSESSGSSGGQWTWGETFGDMFGGGNGSITFDSNAEEVANETASLFGDDLTQDVNVTDGGSGSSLHSSLVSMFGTTITQKVNVSKVGGGTNVFAEGGRATEASIFGEAGAEWAIPEKHTERTAELLNSARKASGFTWAELIQRNGGLNAGSSGGNTVIYSPTINASDSSGVERVLRDDKSRFDKWLRDHQMVKEITSYA